MKKFCIQFFPTMMYDFLQKAIVRINVSPITKRTFLSSLGAAACTLGQPVMKPVVLRFYTPVTEDAVGRLMNTIDNHIRRGAKQVTLLISSPGGSVFAGLTAYHYLKGIPAEVTTHNFGSVDSIASVIYCAGKKRYAVPDARFLLHPISLNIGSPMTLDEGGMEERLKLMKQEAQTIASVLAATVNRTVPNIETALAQRTVLTTEEARKWGLVHETRSVLYSAGDEIFPVAAVNPQQESLTLPEKDITTRDPFTVTSRPLRASSAPQNTVTKADSFSTLTQNR